MQRPERDEDEHVKQRRRLEIEGRRLLILEMEAPDQQHQQADVDDDGDEDEPAGQPPCVGQRQAHQREAEVAGEHVRDRHERRARGGLGRDRVKREEEADQRQLRPADQDLGSGLLALDGSADPPGQLAADRFAEDEVCDPLPHARPSPPREVRWRIVRHRAGSIHGPCTAGLRLQPEQAAGKSQRFEGAHVFHALTDADGIDRQAELLRQCDHDAALGRAVDLGHD